MVCCCCLSVPPPRSAKGVKDTKGVLHDQNTSCGSNIRKLSHIPAKIIILRPGVEITHAADGKKKIYRSMN